MKENEREGEIVRMRENEKKRLRARISIRIRRIIFFLFVSRELADDIQSNI